MSTSETKPLVVRQAYGNTQVLSIRVSEVWRADTIDALGHAIRREIEASGAGGRFVLDLSEVTFLTSAALGLLMNLHAHLSKRGYPFVLAGAQGEVARVFEHVRLGEVLPLYPTVEDAVRNLRCC